jgi:hypothetical protein
LEKLKGPKASSTMKKLNPQDLKSRRKFLKEAARKAVAPIVTVYAVNKTTLKVFGREPE